MAERFQVFAFDLTGPQRELLDIPEHRPFWLADRRIFERASRDRLPERSVVSESTIEV